MERNILTQQQLERDRAAYHYLEALDTGDIDAILAILKKAAYDASLEQMVLDAHQAYFQVTPGERIQSLVGQNAEVNLPTIEERELLPLAGQPTMPLRLPSRRGRRKRVWLSTLAAVLIVGLLIGSFLGLMKLRSQSTLSTEPSPPPSSTQGAWRIVSTPNIPNSSLSMSALAALSAHDAWAVGSFASASSPGTMTPLILHWDGSAWKQVSSASTAKQGVLSAVAALAPDDVWTVGRTGTSLVANASVEPWNDALIEHWNGQRWNVISSSKPEQANVWLRGITALAPNNIWAVGTSTSRIDGTQHAFIEHWDGSHWSMVPTPVIGATQQLIQIAALSPTDIWAVGSFALTTDLTSKSSQTLIEHWDGSSWQAITSPSLTASSLTDISASSPTDIWAVGTFRSDDAFPPRTLVEHWDGKQWSIIRSPNPALKADNTLLAVAALASNDVWASDFQTGSQLLHWNGKQWQVIRAPTPAQENGTPIFGGFARDPSRPGVLWMAGIYHASGPGWRILIEINES